MNLHELKIWIDGFKSALKDQGPSKEQWQAVVEKIGKAHDASTKTDSPQTGFLLSENKKK